MPDATARKIDNSLNSLNTDIHEFTSAAERPLPEGGEPRGWRLGSQGLGLEWVMWATGDSGTTYTMIGATLGMSVALTGVGATVTGFTFSMGALIGAWIDDRSDFGGAIHGTMVFNCRCQLGGDGGHGQESDGKWYLNVLYTEVNNTSQTSDYQLRWAGESWWRYDEEGRFRSYNGNDTWEVYD